MNRKQSILIQTAFVAALVVPLRVAAQQLTVTLEPVPGQVITGGATIRVEAFVANGGPDFESSSYSVDLACFLPGDVGATGEVWAQPPGGCTANADCPAGATCSVSTSTCNSIVSGDRFSLPASGSVPWMYTPIFDDFPCGPTECTGPLRPRVQGECRFGGIWVSPDPPPQLPPNILPAGSRRYLGAIRYRISECASGSFTLPFESLSVPCSSSDLTNIIDSAGQCVQVNFVPGRITIPVGRCCTDGVCLADDVNSACCASMGGVEWTEGRTCDEPCPQCQTDADCDDGRFCNGPETCNPATRQCLPGAPPDCPGATSCIEAFCDAEAAGGTGACSLRPRPPGTPCDDGSACTEFDACDGAGQCQGSPRNCDDGLFCTGAETCLPGTGCVSGTPPCPPDEMCDEATDSCRPAVIPTASAWGLIVLTLALCSAAKVRFRRTSQSLK